MSRKNTVNVNLEQVVLTANNRSWCSSIRKTGSLNVGYHCCLHHFSYHRQEWIFLATCDERRNTLHAATDCTGGKTYVYTILQLVQQ